jgi:hypothetical protein
MFSSTISGHWSDFVFYVGRNCECCGMENEGIKLITREDDEGFRVAAEYAFRLNHALMFPNQPIDEKAMKDVIERQLKEFKKEK